MREEAGRARFAARLHNGSGQTDVQWYFREQASLPVAVQRWEIPPGGTEGMHEHPPGDAALEELYVLVSGAARMTVDGEEHVLAPGDAVLARAGAEHDVRNDGPDPAVLMVVWGHPGEGMDWRRYRTGVESARAADESA